MQTEGLKATEAECAAGRTAPRVSLKDIEGAIAETTFVNAADAVGSTGGFTVRRDGSSSRDALKLLTICFVVMHNGFTIIGKAAPASPENFDAELGKKLAYEDAVRQIWPLLGFALREKLAAAPRGYGSNAGPDFVSGGPSFGGR